MNREIMKLDNDLEHYLYAGKDGIFRLGTDLRHKGCPECDPSIKMEGGYYNLCEKHYEKIIG